MTVAAGAADFGADHSELFVLIQIQMLLIERRVERSPARAGIEFVVGAEKRQTAQPTGINARFFIVGQIAAKRRFGAVFKQDVISFRVQIPRQSCALVCADRRNVITRS